MTDMLEQARAAYDRARAAHRGEYAAPDEWQAMALTSIAASLIALVDELRSFQHVYVDDRTTDTVANIVGINHPQGGGGE